MERSEHKSFGRIRPSTTFNMNDKCEHDICNTQSPRNNNPAKGEARQRRQTMSNDQIRITKQKYVVQKIYFQVYQGIQGIQGYKGLRGNRAIKGSKGYRGNIPLIAFMP